MTEQYPINNDQPVAAEAAFNYLRRKDQEDVTDIFGDIGYFEPLPPLQDGEVTHYAFPVNYLPAEDGTSLSRIMIAGMREDKPVGFGQVAAFRSLDGDIFSGPFVVYTETEADERRKGYGRGRLIAMNAYAGECFGQQLKSDVNMTDEAKSIWQGLVKDGLAEEQSSRFRFREVGTTSTD